MTSRRTMPDGEIVELTPAQASWIDPLYAAHAADERRDPNCDGCTVFGLCVAHSTTNEAP